MHKIHSFLIAVFLIAGIVFTGCEQPSSIESITTGNCIIAIQEDKSLVTEVNNTIAEYLYKATPQFSGTATGTVSEWSHLSYGGQGTVGLLTQGKWKFDVKGLNSSGTVITIGSAIGYIDPGKDNVIEVQMHTEPSIGTGSVSFAIWTQNVSENETIMKVYHREKNGSSWTAAAEYSEKTAENVRLVGSINNLKAGYHDILFILFDKTGAALGGEQVGVQVVAGHQTSISGIIEPAAEIGLDITIKSMGYVHGLLSPTTDILVEGEGRDRVAYMERGDEVTFSWVDQDDASSIPTEWIWAFDGEVVSSATGKTYTVQFDEYGEHELSVIGIRRDETGKAWDVGSAVIKIVVVRHICEITFHANGGFYPNGTDIYIISEDTTLPETRQIPGGQPYDGLSPARTGYVLTSWQDMDTGETVVTIDKDGNVTFLDGFVTKKDTRRLRAIWEAGTYELTVVWGENVTANGKKTEYSTTHKIQCGDPLTILDSNAKREGFIFHGYTTEENGRGVSVNKTDKYIWGKNVTLYANWEYIPIKVGFYKSYSDYVSGKAPYKYIEVGSDLRYGSLPQPLRQGKVFKGWAQPEDVDGSQTETVEGHQYLTNDALKEGGSFVEVKSFVRKYHDHSLVSVWGEGTIKISFDYANADLTEKGKQSINAFAKDENNVYYKYGALGTMYGALPFTGIETEVRNGWEFMGWYDSPSYSMRVYDISAVTTMDDHTLYGKWEGRKLTVTFDTGTAETYPSKEVRYGNQYGELPEPTRYGYDFEGWWYNGKLIKADSYVEVGNNHTLTAKWTAKQTTISLKVNGGTWGYPIEYTINYNDTYGQAKSGNTVLGDSSTSDKLKNPTRYGYDFAGWFGNPGGSGNRYNGNTTNTAISPLTFYALWNAHMHKLIFHYQWPKSGVGADVTQSPEIAFGSSYGALPAPELRGFTFNGWFTDATAGTQVSINTKLEEDNDINLYGHWSVTKINISFYEDGAVCKDESGVALKPVTREFGTKYGPLPTPAKKGYVFTGMWQVQGQYNQSTGELLQVSENSIVEFTQDVTLIPVWSPADILVVYIYDGEVTETGTIDSLNMSQYKLSSVKFNTAFVAGKTVNVSGNTWSATNSSFSIPVWKKTGHWQDGWFRVLPGVSREKIDPTVTLTDFAKLENIAKSTIGSLTPDRTVYMIPAWEKNSYNIKFHGLLQNDNGTITEATGAPYIDLRRGYYGDTLAEAFGTSNLIDIEPKWNGYRIIGWYTDSNCTVPLNLNLKLGMDACAPDATELTIYAKWAKVYTKFVYNINEDRYPNNSRDILYKASDMYNSFGDGWYDFTGVVNDINYTDGSFRKVSKDNQALTLSELTLDFSTSPVSKSFTAPGVTRVYIDNYSAMNSYYNIVCARCGGRGYTGTYPVAYPRAEDEGHKGIIPGFVGDPYGVQNGKAIKLGYKNGSYYPEGSMKAYNGPVYSLEYRWYSPRYGSCPDDGNGCVYWPNRLRNTTASACPGCNGNPYYDQLAVREITEYHSGSCDEDCPSGCTEDHSWSETTTHVYLETCYCVKAGSPGAMTSGHSRIEWLAGFTSIYKNGTEIIKSDPNRQITAYTRCTSPNLPYVTNWFGGCTDYPTSNATNHYDPDYRTFVFDAHATGCTNCEGRRAIARRGPVCMATDNALTTFDFSVQKGDVINTSMYIPDVIACGYFEWDGANAGKIRFIDDASGFGRYALTQNGISPVTPSYDNYKITAGKYCTVGTTSITTAPATKYYGYTGSITRHDEALGKPVGSDYEETSGTYNVNTSKSCTFRAVTADGTVYTGTPTKINWNKVAITVTYKDSSGNSRDFITTRRLEGSGLENPLKEMTLEFWIY